MGHLGFSCFSAGSFGSFLLNCWVILFFPAVLLGHSILSCCTAGSLYSFLLYCWVILFFPAVLLGHSILSCCTAGSFRSYLLYCWVIPFFPAVLLGHSILSCCTAGSFRSYLLYTAGSFRSYLLYTAGSFRSYLLYTAGSFHSFLLYCWVIPFIPAVYCWVGRSDFYIFTISMSCPIVILMFVYLDQNLYSLNSSFLFLKVCIPLLPLYSSIYSTEWGQESPKPNCFLAILSLQLMECFPHCFSLQGSGPGAQRTPGEHQLRLRQGMSCLNK